VKFGLLIPSLFLSALIDSCVIWPSDLHPHKCVGLKTFDLILRPPFKAWLNYEIFAFVLILKSGLMFKFIFLKLDQILWENGLWINYAWYCILLKPGLLCTAVNFINILRTNVSYQRLFGSFFYVNVTREKLPKLCSYEKCVRILLMKLTPGLPCYMLTFKFSLKNVFI